MSSFKLFLIFTKLCSLGTCKWMFNEFPKSSILIGGRGGSLLTLHPVNSVFYDCIIFFFCEPNFFFPRTTDKVPSFILVERFCNECSIDKRIVSTSFFLMSNVLSHCLFFCVVTEYRPSLKQFRNECKCFCDVVFSTDISTHLKRTESEAAT